MVALATAARTASGLFSSSTRASRPRRARELCGHPLRPRVRWGDLIDKGHVDSASGGSWYQRIAQWGSRDFVDSVAQRLCVALLGAIGRVCERGLGTAPPLAHASFIKLIRRGTKHVGGQAN